MSDRYAVIGRPINHTKSPLIHGLFAQACGQQLEYGAIEGSLEGFEAQVLAFRGEGGLGMNITAPFKLRAFELAERCSERAQLARAANALKFENGGIVAENFDGIGLLRDIEVNLGEPLHARRVLVLGAGGAVRGALLPFLQAGPAELVIANRDMAKAVALRNELNHPRLRISRYEELPGQAFDIVVNATSASLVSELPPLPAEALANTRLAYELAYGKGLTPFLRLAREQGVARLADGVGMLVEQAAEAFAWWRGVRPETGAVIDRLTIPLE
ncbi:shikimate dehydrogenase [Pseudomonas juntendi]|uniref:Shikimate dehydrogenase (NADP(+)) n=1 Tax=Pseudomonas juntendi TaxID=2666183 RepID=A0A7W2LQN0_9PSED|nr:shikimate dehydrogenase [Pseudomonas juntendi]OAK62613.1 shikimate dehydrogenase [Pseudomonas putida]PPB17277.1 shikimate dehydrogenase [Pseudomonas aeruginosa]MBA6145161.1 shikimate dehydrogenase [Pseudomonas juntendi]MCL8330771.1 shikimate dehydrogenase [Pseudomonas juntendi]QEQ88550.1 shikimate dehydrogenase [Pseudomonas putida]